MKFPKIKKNFEFPTVIIKVGRVQLNYTSNQFEEVAEALCRSKSPTVKSFNLNPESSKNKDCSTMFTFSD